MKYPWQLYHWHFEVSGKCTLKCPRCPRNEADPVPWLNKELDLNFFKKTLSPSFLQDTVKRITFCGDVGDPIYASQFLDIVDYLKTCNPKLHIYTITNGSYKKTSWWKDFASISNEYDTINFSVDGYDQDSNNLYRVNSDWNSIMDGINIMCNESKAFVYWAAIVFSFNQDHIQQLEKIAKTMGCDGLQITLSTKFGSKYGQAYGGDSDNLEPRSEFISKSHRYERHLTNLSGRVQLNQDYLDTNTVKFYETKKNYNKFVTPLCLVGNRGLYVSADGVLHPCSWVSYPYKSLHTDRKMIQFENSFHQRYRKEINLHEHNLDTVLNNPLWSKLMDSFDNKDKAWVECEQKCHSNLMSDEYGIGWLTN